MTEMHDSGSRQQFEGGAVRDTAEGKARIDFLSPWVWPLLTGTENAGPFDVAVGVRDYLLKLDVMDLKALLIKLLKGPQGIERLCRWLELGAQKYDYFNWAKGMPMSRCVASLGRHFVKWKLDDEDHVAAFMCNLMFMLHYHCEYDNGRFKDEWFDLPNFSELTRPKGNRL